MSAHCCADVAISPSSDNNVIGDAAHRRTEFTMDISLASCSVRLLKLLDRICQDDPSHPGTDPGEPLNACKLWRLHHANDRARLEGGEVDAPRTRCES